MPSSPVPDVSVSLPGSVLKPNQDQSVSSEIYFKLL